MSAKSLLLGVVSLVVVVSLFPVSARAQGEPSAQISNLSYEYSDGMFTITFKLDVQNMRGKDIRIALWPRDASTDEFVLAGMANGSYVTPDGHLTTQVTVTSPYDNTTWDPFTLSIPFSAFPRTSGVDSYPYGEIDWYPFIQVKDISTGANILSQDSAMDLLVISNASFRSLGQSQTNTKSGCSKDIDCDGISDSSEDYLAPLCETDKDCDFISDELELYLAQSFMPVFEFDEQEHNPITGSIGIQEGVDVIYLYQVSEVKCGVHYGTLAHRFILEPKSSTKPLGTWIAPYKSYLLTVVATYAYDYLPYDPGPGEDDRFNHYGDTERVRICITQQEQGGDLSLASMYINRHNEQGMYIPSDIPEWENPHPYLYVSEGKHATFVSNGECRGSVSLSVTDILVDPLEGENWQWLGFQEDCGGGQIIRPTVLDSYNVGEPGYLIPGSGRFTMHDMAIVLAWPFDMDPFGLEAVWSAWADDSNNRDHYFCGGFNIDNYQGEHNVAPKYDSPWCAGSLSNKWWDSSK